ncbi:hypothetical protein ACWDUN_17255 [Mycobacterium sp. NPDC003323]
MTDFAPTTVISSEVSKRRRRRGHRILVGGLAFTVTFALLILSVVLITDRSNEADDAERLDQSRRVAFAHWWNEAHPDVSALQAVLDEVQRAMRHADAPALASACQVMHDVAAVKVPAHLPGPEQELGAQLGAAAADAHSAAHMCLSVLEQTLNNYDAEFVSDVEQADRQVKAAMSTANEYLAESFTAATTSKSLDDG